MENEKTWEDETVELIREAQEERRKAEVRLTAAQRAIEAADAKVAGLQLALNAYRAKYGMPQIDAVGGDPAIAEEFRHMPIKAMVAHWADKHGGEFVCADAARVLTTAGLFPNQNNASSALYQAASRLPEFEKSAPGRFRRIDSSGVGIPTITLAESHREPDDDKDEHPSRLISFR